MKRDFDLIRMILRQVEDSPPSAAPIKVEIEGYDNAVIGEHVALLIDAGLLEGVIVQTISDPRSAIPSRLTWDGHDFLNAATDSVWAKAKEHVIKPAGSATFSLLLEWMKAEARTRLGLG